MNIRNAFKNFKNSYQFSKGGIPLKEKFALALPGPASVIGNTIVHGALLKYYADIIGMDPKYVGWIYFFFNLWNAINDPLLGVYVDKFKYRPDRGKYVYLMRVTAPIMLFASFAMLFSSPAWQDWVIFIILLIELFIFDSAYTIYTVSYQSYFLIAAPTKEDRIDVEVIRSYVGNVLGFLGTLVPTLLLVGNSNRKLIIPVFIAVLGVNALAYVFALRTLKDKRELYENIKQPDAYHNVRKTWKEAGEIIKSKPFWTITLYNVIARGSMNYYFTPFLFFMDKVLRSSGLVATLADVLPGIVVLTLMPLIGTLIKKIGSKNTIIISYIPAFIGFGGLLVINTGWQAIICYTFIVLSLYLSGTANIPIGGALVDENEQRTGIRKTGLFNGLGVLMATTFLSFQSIVFTNIISWFGYDGRAAVQTESAIWGIRVGAGLVPIVMGIIGIIPLLMFPMSKKIEQEISEKNAILRGINIQSEDPLQPEEQVS